MLFSLGHAFEQGRFADVDVLLLAPQPDPGTQDQPASAAQEIRRFPGHMLVLGTSPYFDVQALRWQQQSEGGEDEPSSKRHKAAEGDVTSGSSSTSQARPTVSLTLSDAEQEPAAMAVLAAMYGAKTPAQLQEELSHKQQLQAAIIADMLQLPVISGIIVDSLVAAAGSSAGPAAEAVQAYLDLPAMPACLLPLLSGVMSAALRQSKQFRRAAIERCLLGVLGDLEAVWANEQLQEVLLDLPLPVMEMLLSCDNLKVASEDTVLYTAQAYLKKTDSSLAARVALAPLIRCPYLSHYWLAAMVVSLDASKLLLSDLIPQVRQLLAAASADVQGELPPDAIRGLVKLVPPSWLLPRRPLASVPGDGVSMQWWLPVAELEAACKKCSTHHKLVYLDSPTGTYTPPLGGLAWRMFLEGEWDKGAGGVKLGVFVKPVAAPSGSFHKFSAVLTCHSVNRRIATRFPTASGMGFGDFFGVGAMSGGWDAAAWSAKGLPTSGELLLELKVTSVNAVQASNGVHGVEVWQGID